MPERDRVVARRRTSGRSVLLSALATALLVSLSSSPSFAQSQVEGEISVQRFDPAPGPRNFIMTRSARTDGEKTWTAGVFVNYGFKPLEITRCVSSTGSCDEAVNRTTQEVAVVENMVTGEAIGSFTPIPRLQLGARIPVTWSKGLGPENRGDLDAVGMGDPLLEAKVRAYGTVDSPIAAGLAAYATAPLGHLTAEDSYIGDESPSVGGRIIVDGIRGPLTWGVNLGGAWRKPATIGATKLGAEARFGLAAGYALSSLLRVVGDGSLFSNFSGDNATTGIEIDGAGQFTPLASPFAITVGAGAGALRGIGVPHFRVFVGFVYSAEVKDRDGDGVIDSVDQCPTEPEDMDGYEDSDGCPDLDNDLDGIPDSRDKCPTEPEDVDGFEDEDGCPDLDNDKDGIPDTADACPLKPETKNGFKDEDGCPDAPDSDSDGIPDSRDQCPNEPEDTDGFQDEDGCPDPDNDGDGVPDVQDECIDEPETMNGFEDEDGCPDEAPQGTKKR